MSQDSLWYRIGRAIGDTVRPSRRPGQPDAGARTPDGRGGQQRPADGSHQRSADGPHQRPAEGSHQRAADASHQQQAAGGSYPGDFTGGFTISYAPHEDALADPGEVVWTWVPYEEDHSQGKDRPVLIVGRDDPWLLAVPLSSKDHELDAAQEASEGRYWVEIGSGEWDRSGRESAVRVNRIVRVDPRSVRRIGARLDKERFEIVAAAIREHTA